MQIILPFTAVSTGDKKLSYRIMPTMKNKTKMKIFKQMCMFISLERATFVEYFILFHLQILHPKLKSLFTRTNMLIEKLQNPLLQNKTY